VSDRRGRLAVIGVVALLGGALALPATAAGVSPALTGELLFYSNSSGFAPPPPLPENEGTVSASTTCDDSGNGTFAYTSTGNANGPLQGGFTLGGNGSFVGGELTSLDADFDISAGGSSSSGSITLDPSSAAIHGHCTVSVYDWDEDGFDDTVTDVTAVGYVNYSANTTINGVTTPESGKAFWRLECITLNADPPCDDSETTYLAFIGTSVPRNASGVGSASTGSVATATDPIATTVDGPDGALIEIAETQVIFPWTSGDYQLLGRTVNIYVYDENFDDVIAPADDPLVVTFDVYKGALDDLGLGINDVGILRDGDPAADCAGPGIASPDPCIASRTLAGDQVTLVVLTTHASEWSVVALGSSVDYEVDGFFAPVHNPGATNVRNVVKAGQSVSLKWRLLADGEPVVDLTSASVTTANYACGLALTTDAAAESPGNSALKNLGDGYYQLNWQTPKSYANSCKTMTLTLAVGGDQVTKTAIFEFRK
jgi:hypothetical protein